MNDLELNGALAAIVAALFVSILTSWLVYVPIQLLKQLPGSVPVGTEVEAAWLAEQLAKAGESPMIEPVSLR
jgi:hypothetical protein